MVDDVVFHLVVRVDAVVCEVAVEVYIAFGNWRHLQGEVGHEVVARGVCVGVVAVAQEEASVLVFVVEIVCALFVYEEVGMVVCVVKFHAVNPHGGGVGVEHLEASIFVACIEDESSVVVEDELVDLHVRWLDVRDMGVPSPILHDDVFKFADGIG